jgi:phosphoribosylaminoimidazole-succinocarboxamide synthase
MEIDPTAQGKVRDIYDLGDKLLMVASDRLSAFDVVLPDPIPHKGEVLTKLSLYWFELLSGMVPNHFLSADVRDLPHEFRAHEDYLAGRFMIVKKAEVLPVECIVRGYLAGSGWAEYQESGTLADEGMPEGLAESSKLPDAAFTPSTKAEIGEHDMNISVYQLKHLVGEHYAFHLMQHSLSLYHAAADHAAARGIIIADTKFEFGVIDDEVTLIDEVLTPDSSRFWPVEGYEPGHAQPSFDKQYVRDWLTASGWDKTPPAPALPADVIAKTSEKYIQAYELITGREFVPERG